jgi:hypothetical protein
MPLCLQALFIAAEGFTVLLAVEGSIAQLSLSFCYLTLLYHPE